MISQRLQAQRLSILPFIGYVWQTKLERLGLTTTIHMLCTTEKSDDVRIRDSHGQPIHKPYNKHAGGRDKYMSWDSLCLLGQSRLANRCLTPLCTCSGEEAGSAEAGRGGAGVGWLSSDFGLLGAGCGLAWRSKQCIGGPALIQCRGQGKRQPL